jgi:uncharacterized membrane protein YheB (UPF0754 family)
MIYTLPIIAAIIGWFTNYLAVKMLFHPRKKVRVLFWDVQGIFPKKHHVLAQRIGKLVAEDLLSVKDIQALLSHPENVSQINRDIEEKIEDYLNNTFPDKYPMLSFFVRGKSRDKIRMALMEEMETMGPELMDKTISNLENKLDIETFIKERVSMFSTVRMEKLIQGILSTEFRFIEWVGAAVGFVIGLIQLIMISL